MDAEQTIADIELLERIFAVPDTRPLGLSDLAASESQARRKTRAQSLVPTLAKLRNLLPP